MQSPILGIHLISWIRILMHRESLRDVLFVFMLIAVEGVTVIMIIKKSGALMKAEWGTNTKQYIKFMYFLCVDCQTVLFVLVHRYKFHCALGLKTLSKGEFFFQVKHLQENPFNSPNNFPFYKNHSIFDHFHHPISNFLNSILILGFCVK